LWGDGEGIENSIEKWILPIFNKQSKSNYAPFYKTLPAMDAVAQLIISIIRRREGRARVQEFRNGSNRIRNKMKPGELESKLKEMVDAGILTVRAEKTEKNRDADYYRIANTVPDNPCAVSGYTNDSDDAD
jgi:hypothetical protein